MKISRIVLAVVSLSLPSIPAFAATGSLASLYNIPVGNIIRISGASALSDSLFAVVTANCTGQNTGDVRELKIVGDPDFALGRVVVCTKSVNFAVPPGEFPVAGRPYAVVKHDINDNSFDAINPVIDQTALPGWANLNICDDIALQCELDSTAPVQGPQVPHAGLSDIDLNVWKGLANTGGGYVSNSAVTTQSGFAGQGFGVMVSESLYRAMQVKQVNEGRLPTGSAPTGCSNHFPLPLATVDTVKAEDLTFTAGRCQPSISKEEYAAVVDGSNFAYVSNGALSGDSGIVNLCGRIETSATQAASNVYFLHNPCNSANPTFGFKLPKKVAFPPGVVLTGNVSGYYEEFPGVFSLFEGTGTGDARNCVIRRNGGKNPNDVADSLGTYAIGWITLQDLPTPGWKLIKLDGISPNAVQNYSVAGGWVADDFQRTNVVNGYYDAAPEMQMLWPASSKYPTFLARMRDRFADPVLVNLFVNLRGVFQANGAFTHAAFPANVHKGTRNGGFCAPQALAE